MAYRDNIDIDLSEDFGEGCSAVIRDPRCVLRSSDLVIRPDMKLTEEQRERQVNERIDDVLRRLIVSWTVYDIETDEPLPIPKTDPSVLSPDHCPDLVRIALFRKVTALMLPFFRKYGATPETSSSSATTESSEAVPSAS